MAKIPHGRRRLWFLLVRGRGGGVVSLVLAD